MKFQKAGKYMLLLFSFLNLVYFINPVFCQEGDDPLRAFRWYYSPRSFPFDTIPRGAFANAIAQRDALRQMTGYQPDAEQWEQIGPLPLIGSRYYSGRIVQVTYDPRDPSGQGNIIYAAGASGGLWKTTDGGLTWNDISGNLPSLSSGAFAITYVNDIKILYFGCGGGTPPYYGDGRSMGIFKSVNDGGTWTSINNGIDWGVPINKIVISPNDQSGNTIFAATTQGLYKTVDGGALWTKIIPRPRDPIQNLICNDVCFSRDGSRVYAVGPSLGHGDPPWNVYDGIGYWRSDDHGNDNTFYPMTQHPGFPHDNVIIDKILCAASKVREDLVWFITFDHFPDGTSDDVADVYRSTDHGDNFTPYPGAGGYVNATHFQLVIRASDNDEHICFAGAQDNCRTTNDGLNWVAVGGYQGGHGDVMGFDFNPFFPSKIIEGNDGGVFRSDNLGNTGTWTPCNQNLGSLSLLWSCASSTYDPKYVAGGLHDNGFAYNTNAEHNSTTWNLVNSGFDGGSMTASPFLSKHFVGNVVNGSGILYTPNGGTFGGADGYDLGTTQSVENPPFVHHPTQPGVVYTVRYGSTSNNPRQIDFRKSTDYGHTWGGDGSPLKSFQRPNGWDNTCPYLIAISQSDPNIIIMNIGNENNFFISRLNAQSRLIKSTDGGLNWTGEPGDIQAIVYGGQPGRGVPNRSFSHVEFDPKDAQIVYLTVSGYYYPNTNEGHVFKSTDGGYNWANISNSLPSGNNLPDAPVTDLIIHYTGTGDNDKELIVSTDLGIYAGNIVNGNWSWREFPATPNGFPNSTALYLDYNRLSGKLRANTWGRGGWQVQIDGTTNSPGPIYVQDKLYITDNVTLNNPIVVTNGGQLILGHPDLPEAKTINFNVPPNQRGILVADGGKIMANSGAQYTLTSPTGWGGIAITYGGSGTLMNCVFQNSELPIQISYGHPTSPLAPSDHIDINGCTFQNGSVDINATGTISTYIENCTFNGSNQTTKTAIELNNSSSVIIYNNTITNSQNGISESAGNSEIWNNNITGTAASVWGISVDNSQNPWIRNNTISDFTCGIHLLNASPTLLSNIINTSLNEDTAIFVGYASNPRLSPSSAGDATLIWDAGRNTVGSSTTGSSNAIVIDQGYPDLDGGYNHINAGNYYITGTLSYGVKYPVTYNCWNNSVNDPTAKINLGGPRIMWQPATCDPPPGAFIPEHYELYEAGGENETGNLTDVLFEPLPPYIIDRGFGHYDTIKVTSGNLELTQNERLYSQGIKQELLGNYSNANTLYKQIVENYHDSLSAVKALIRMLPCADNISSDSSRYTTLGNYYQSVVQNYPSDTLLRKAANELSHKTLIRRGHFPPAINAYETDIQNTNDSLEILCYQLNIVETYMLIQEHGGQMVRFTGMYKDLKPANTSDGFRLIYDLLHRIKQLSKSNSIPTVFSLSQNYPNPFNPTTTIKYAIPQPVKVNIKIYDILGRLVKTLINDEYKEVGFYEVKFDGSNFASGVYFYKIEAGKFVQSKKMVVLK